MLKVRTILGACTLAVGTVVFAASCSENTVSGPEPDPRIPDEFAGPGPQFTHVVGASCIGDDVVRFDKFNLPQDNPEAINCTANDVDIAFADVGPGSDLECDEGDPVTINLIADIEQVANSDRKDGGLWIATDGGNARHGECEHFYLDLTGDADGWPGISDLDGDDCGDLEEKAVVNDYPLGMITVTCADPDEDGLLEISSCTAWQVPSDPQVCPDPDFLPGDPDDAARSGTAPTNSAKCECALLEVPVTVRKTGKLEVVKACDPTNDDGTFDLKIDGGTADEILEDDAECGDSTGEQIVSAGTTADPGAVHTVSEDDFTTANYTSSWVCEHDGGAQISSGNGTGPVNVTVNPDDDIVCTFTNTRKATVIIKKETDPDGLTDNFTFTQNVDASGNFMLADGGMKTFNNVTPGSFTVSEVDPTPGFDLTDITCVDSDAGGTASTDAGLSATINLDPGETVTCTFTNTQRGTVVIKKETVPDGLTDNFTFTQDVDASGNFMLADGGMKTFTNVMPGAYSVSETDPNPTFDLTDITCLDTDAGGTASTDAGLTATINLDAGETVTCTYTNTQRAMVTVNKTQSGSPAAGFTFEIRKDASTEDAGTVIATGTSDGAGVVNFACTAAGIASEDCLDDSGMGKFLPGDYQLCETGMLPGWMNNLDGFTPEGAVSEGGDNSTECVDIVLAAGDTGVPGVPTGDNPIPDPIDNTPPPGGDARTIGFWKNWTSCDGHGNQDDVLDQTLDLAGGSIQIGDLLVDDCETAVLVLDKRDLGGQNRKRASDACYGLAAQLLAAELNIVAGAGTCAALTTAVSDAQMLLDDNNYDGTGQCLRPKDADYQEAVELAETLDDYNNNLLCGP